MKKIIFGLLLILLISGCAGLSDIFQPSGPQVKELPPDVIVVQNMNVLPPPPITAGDQFSIYFEITNQEEKKVVESVTYDLLDDGLCNRISGDETYNYSDFVPGETEIVELTFGTPTSEKIAYLSTTCPVRFKVTYDFEAVSEVEVDVISQTRLKELQQKGNFTTFTPTLTIGRGPIKIYLSFGASMPIKSGSVLPVYITVEDKGTGLLPKILPGKLSITNLGGGSCTRLTCNGDTCYNEGEILMVGRKSPTLRCSFTTPSVDVEKTFFIRASMDYTYSVIKEVEVEVEPLLV